MLLQGWQWAFAGLFIKIIVACKGSRQPLVTLQGGAGLFITSELNKEGINWLEGRDNALVLPSPLPLFYFALCAEQTAWMLIAALLSFRGHEEKLIGL